jgi:hypothetical protein
VTSETQALKRTWQGPIIEAVIIQNTKSKLSQATWQCDMFQAVGETSKTQVLEVFWQRHAAEFLLENCTKSEISTKSIQKSNFHDLSIGIKNQNPPEKTKTTEKPKSQKEKA